MKRVACIVIGCIALITAAHGASFDCAKAQSKVEKLVCGNEELSGLDDSLNDIYQQQVYKIASSETFKHDQLMWLKTVRNVCEDVVCLKLAYEERINELAKGFDPDDLSDRSLTLICDFSANPATSIQRVSVVGAVFGRGEPASVKTFSTDSKRPEKVSLVVKPGEFAECVYPSGFRVRVKVGEGRGYPYGMCGGDPEVFLSLWVNDRKVASRVWFAGHCREDNDKTQVTFRISAKPCGPSSRETVCTDFPNLNGYPVDRIEYPENGKQPPKVGDLELVEGGGRICTAMQEELKKGFFDKAAGASKADDGDFSYPEWRNLSVDLPKGFEGASAMESTFDFDNDGKLDRVISLEFMTHYMDGTSLLVQPGLSSASQKEAVLSLDKNSMLIPCQVSGQPADVRECPPFSQKWDEAGFIFGGESAKNAIRFRARYADVKPFTYKGTSYMLTQSGSEDTSNYFAILKPQPKRKFEYTCLFRQVVENF